MPRMLNGEDRPVDQLPDRNTSLWLLCLPCWVLGVYALIVIAISKMAPGYSHVVVSKKFTIVPTIFAIASPFLWLTALMKSIRRYHRTGLRLPAIWSFVFISGIVMIVTWGILLHFRRA